MLLDNILLIQVVTKARYKDMWSLDNWPDICDICQLKLGSLRSRSNNPETLLQVLIFLHTNILYKTFNTSFSKKSARISEQLGKCKYKSYAKATLMLAGFEDKAGPCNNR